ncbi:uncharacterized protein LOC124110747 [Haliotis rufescens]|uniref:uncharacterized protein LOC124110747 n=1 Tax=Haliotis rufescens TaxID=6454 RepID=UPI001EAF9307|nr:uncharacterized protein LOC124110747 [Haliotis rufescens]
MADLRVRHGKDIMSASAFVDELESETSIKLYLIGDANAEEANLKQLQLKPIPGTMSLHQIIVTAPGHLHYRDVSCSCSVRKPCKGHDAKDFLFALSRLSTSQHPTRKRVKRPNKGSSEKHIDVTTSDFDSILAKLQACSDFESLQEECLWLDLEEIEGQSRSALGNILTVDQRALDMYPNDVPGDKVLFPTIVRADRECLPSSGSIFAYGMRTDPMKCRLA